MEKLANGNENPNVWSLEASCTGEGWNQENKIPCNALFKLNQSDIYKRKYTDISGDTELFYGFICPDCGCFTELNASKIPSYVKSIAKDYTLWKNNHN